MQAKIKTSEKSVFVTIIVALVLSFVFLTTGIARADDTIDELNTKSSSLQDKIAKNQKELDEVQKKANTLENKVASLDLQIGGVQDEIDLTELKIEKLDIEIKEKEEDLEQRKTVLGASLRTLYKEGDVSPAELVAASSTFSDFVDSQEYLNRLKTAVQDSAKEVQELKTQLEADQEEQEDLLNDQKAQRTVLDAQRFERQELLDQTRGEEAEYQAIVGDLEDQRAAIEAELDAYIASLAVSGVSLGPVSKGDVVGTLGNTGYSTGPHLHFSMHKNGAVQNPYTYLNDGYTWPVPGSGYVSQGYGCVPNALYPNSGCAAGWGFHDALDIAGPEGIVVVSPADGEIVHRGCLWEGTVFSSFVVIVNHPGGVQSTFVHLQAPNSSYSCNKSTVTGQLSVQS